MGNIHDIHTQKTNPGVRFSLICFLSSLVGSLVTVCTLRTWVGWHMPAPHSGRRLRQKEGVSRPCATQTMLCANTSLFCRGTRYWEQGPFFPIKSPSSFSPSFNTAITYVVLRACEWGNSSLVFPPPHWGKPAAALHTFPNELRWGFIPPLSFSRS